MQWRERWMRRGVTVLMYHRVLSAEQCEGYPLPSLVMPCEVFAEQVQWLAAHCRVLPVGQAVTALAQHDPGDRPLVSLTFDDGYADNFDIAAPILEQSDLRATFFITTGFVDSGRPLWFDRAAAAWRRLTAEDRRLLLADECLHASSTDVADIQAWMEPLKRASAEVRMQCVQRAEAMAGDPGLRCASPRPEGSANDAEYAPMTAEQIVQLHQQGHEIASHSVTHPILPLLNDDELRDEVTRPAERLAQIIGSAPAGFCYPNGDVDDRVEQAVRDAGYTYACTTQAGLNERGGNSLRLNRVPINMQRTARSGQHDELGFRAELCGLRERWRSRIN